jgi:hypothetical protein
MAALESQSAEEIRFGDFVACVNVMPIEVSHGV